MFKNGLSRVIGLSLTCLLREWLRRAWVLYRLENATLAVIKAGDKSVLTPDLKGTGTTSKVVDAVIRNLETKYKGRYD